MNRLTFAGYTVPNVLDDRPAFCNLLPKLRDFCLKITVYSVHPFREIFYYVCKVLEHFGKEWK